MKNILEKICKKVKTFHINHFFPKSCRLWDNVEKCGRSGQATDCNVRVRMRFAHWRYGVHCTTYIVYFNFRAKDSVMRTRSIRK